jgi:hypothetical protein
MEIHPPEGGIHSWRGFLVHMATIVLGILIAIGLEQMVEAIHHRHQREQLNADLRDDIRSVLGADAMNKQRGAEMRTYMVALRDAVDARRAGQKTTDVQKLGNVNLIHPTMASWEAAKESGLVVLLPAQQIRLYDRFLFQLSQVDSTIMDFRASSFALQSFEGRFMQTPGGFDYGKRPISPELSSMSHEDLAEYSRLLSAEIASLDRLLVRVGFVDAEARALNDGAKTEDELVRAVLKS